MWELLITKYRFYTYAGIIFLALLIIFIVLGVNNRARVKDVALVNELKEFSYGLETYFSNYRRYPEAQDLNLNNYLIISDNGLAEAQGSVYYKGSVEAGKAVYSSDSSSYEIEFKLRRNWNIGSANEGKYCIISEGYKINCAENKEE